MTTLSQLNQVGRPPLDGLNLARRGKQTTAVGRLGAGAGGGGGGRRSYYTCLPVSLSLTFGRRVGG